MHQTNSMLCNLLMAVSLHNRCCGNVRKKTTKASRNVQSAREKPKRVVKSYPTLQAIVGSGFHAICSETQLCGQAYNNLSSALPPVSCRLRGLSSSTSLRQEVATLQQDGCLGVGAKSRNLAPVAKAAKVGW